MRPYRVTVHCSDSQNNAELPLANIRRDHIENRGFSDVAYQVVIQPSGEVEKGRSLIEKGAHVKGANEGNVGICLIGRDKFTTAQFKSLYAQLEGLRLSYGIKPWEIYCHYEFPSARSQGKDCPNIRATNLVLWYVTGDWEPIKPYLLKEK